MTGAAKGPSSQPRQRACADTSLCWSSIGHAADLCGARRTCVNAVPLRMQKERPGTAPRGRSRPLPRSLCQRPRSAKRLLPAQTDRLLAWRAGASGAASGAGTSPGRQSRHRRDSRARGGAPAAAGRRAGHAPRSRAGREPCSCRRSGNRAAADRRSASGSRLSVSVWMYLRSFSGITSSSAGGT